MLQDDISAPIKKNAKEVWQSAKRPVAAAADWMSTLKNALRIDTLKNALSKPQRNRDKTSHKVYLTTSPLTYTKSSNINISEYVMLSKQDPWQYDT